MNQQERAAYRRGFDRIEWKPMPPMPEYDAAPSKRGAFPTPMVVGDSQDPLRSMADGKMYTSKSAMRRSYRADGNPEGVEFTEVGNDAARFKPKPKPQVDEAKIEASIGKAISRAKLNDVI